jgi:hypothetical protein
VTDTIGGNNGRLRAWPVGSYDDAHRVPLWLDTPDRPAARSPLAGPTEVDLLVVGAGFTGVVDRAPGDRAGPLDKRAGDGGGRA